MEILGPKDPRRRRRRCIQCISAHIKCSGLLPCVKCIRRGRYCTYFPPPNEKILIKNGKHLTPAGIRSGAIVAPLPVSKNRQYYDRFFDAFVATNNFSCAGYTWIRSLRTSIGRDAMVATSITAVGALHAYKTTQVSLKDESLLKCALSSYQEAVSTLRKNLSIQSEDVDLCSTISATFLLGLFELMYDESGDGWKRHMMYGIARLIDLNGPDAFHSPEAQSLYREVRLFEISRAVLLSQNTALAQKCWLSFNHRLLANDERSHAKEVVFDLMLSCADLSQRLHHYLDASDETMLEDIVQLQRFAFEGFELQLQLLDLAKTIFRSQQVGHDAEHTLLAQIYYFATIIYLSGVYDYDCIWQGHGISTPTVSQPVMDEYVLRILEHATSAIHNSNISHLLLLVPLRIAAARCNTQEQQRQITELLLKIQATFAVASAFLAEIRDLWAARPLPAP